MPTRPAGSIGSGYALPRPCFSAWGHFRSADVVPVLGGIFASGLALAAHPMKLTAGIMLITTLGTPAVLSASMALSAYL